jgi:MarR-like DNA-binding transcriptional regulator SgrR of sgrS sRNA
MAEQLRQRLAELGCELTIIFMTRKTGMAASSWRRRT